MLLAVVAVVRHSAAVGSVLVEREEGDHSRPGTHNPVGAAE